MVKNKNFTITFTENWGGGARAPWALWADAYVYVRSKARVKHLSYDNIGPPKAP